MLRRGGDHLASLRRKLQHGAVDGSANAGLFEQRFGNRYVRASRLKRRFQPIWRRNVTLGRGGRITAALLLKIFLGFCDVTAGVCNAFGAAGTLAFRLKFVLEYEAGIRHCALGRKHVVLGIAKIVASFVERLRVTLSLARCGFGFSRLQTGARLFVIEPDQKFAFFDLVVQFYGDFGNAPEKLCADANEAGLRLDATGRGGDPVEFLAPPSRLSKYLRQWTLRPRDRCAK